MLYRQVVIDYGLGCQQKTIFGMVQLPNSEPFCTFTSRSKLLMGQDLLIENRLTIVNLICDA